MIFKFQLPTDQLPDVLLMPSQNTDDQLTRTIATAAKLSAIPGDWIATNFKGAEEETLLLPADNAQSIVLIGLGSELTFDKIYKSFRKFSFQNKKILSGKIGLNLLPFGKSATAVVIAEAAVNGLIVGQYDIGIFKNKKTKQARTSLKDLILYVSESQLQTIETAAESGLKTGGTQVEILDLVNAPANKKTPQHLAEWAKNSGSKYGFEVTVFDEGKIESAGLAALLSVSRGSDNPPAFIIMEYKPQKTTVPNMPLVGLVGKGVTFDTGGLSIKPSSNMHYMKSDMGGAAAVLGAIELTAKLQLPIHLIAIVPSTENSIDAKSTKPGDVINSYSGKTIEVIDTDAEGRLILADGLAYLVKNYQPEYLIDLATLTGSSVRTLGYHAAALFSNNDSLAAHLINAGNTTGERVWRLPLWEVYQKDLDSDIADIKNLSAKPVAGAITAAKFLEAFTNDHPKWAHLDIAGVAFGTTELGAMKNATGYGIRLLTQLFRIIGD